MANPNQILRAAQTWGQSFHMACTRNIWLKRLVDRKNSDKLDANAVVRSVIKSLKADHLTTIHYDLSLEKELDPARADFNQFERLIRLLCIRVERDVLPGDGIAVETTNCELAGFDDATQLPGGRYVFLSVEAISCNPLRHTDRKADDANLDANRSLAAADLAAIETIVARYGGVAHVTSGARRNGVSIYLPTNIEASPRPHGARESGSHCSASLVEQTNDIAV